MSYILQAGLFSGILAAFVVPKIQDLQVNPENQSVYYQNQSVQMLDRISQQLASVGSQISTNFTPQSPYPTFYPSASDRRVNIFWLTSLSCSLSAALLATLVQQWVRSYIRKSSNPLKTARIRLFLLEGTERITVVAEVVPGLIHVSVILFFCGLGDLILHIDTTVFVATVVPIVVCACLYLYCSLAPIWNSQSPYRTPFSGIIWNLIRKLLCSPRYMPSSIEIRQEQSAMKVTKGRMDRDVRAIQWLIDNIDGRDEIETFVLAIPGSFNQEWGRKVWKGVVGDVLPVSASTGTVDLRTRSHPRLSSPREQATVYYLSRFVWHFFGTYLNETDFINAEERLRRMRIVVETVASLVCCTDVELGLFRVGPGRVGEVLSELGDKERTNDPLTIISNPLFTMRWTCLSLVGIRTMIDGNQIKQLSKFALDGITHFQTGFDNPDVGALTAAQRLDGYLKSAWAPVVDLYLAFEPWDLNRTESEVREILNSHEESVLELEHIASETEGVEDLDWRISLLQDAMDRATEKLMRCLPGVNFSNQMPLTFIMISEAFDFVSRFSSVGTTSGLPQLIFPGQQIQSLCTLGRRLRDIIEGRNTEMHDETLKSLESFRKVPVSFPRLNYLMKRQTWRLMDLIDGGGLGFTIELFFLALRPLSSASFTSKLMFEFYTGTFKAITFNWEKSKNSAGTQRILLDLLCDLVIRRRGVFSDFSYPQYIVDMLVDLVEKMVKGHGGKYPHINDVIQELEDDHLWNRMDHNLRDQALGAIFSLSDTASL